MLFGCSNPNQEYITNLENYSNNNDLGLDIDFKVLDFKLIDTVYQKDQANDLKGFIDSVTVQLNSLPFTKEDLTQLRWQEKELRRYPEYYTDVVDNDEMNSPWLNELRPILKRTDIVLDNFDESDILEKYYLYLWFKKRESHYYQLAIKSKYDQLMSIVSECQSKAVEIESLEKDPDKLVYYLANVNFSQINPILNNAEQKLNRDYKFGPDKKVLE